MTPADLAELLRATAAEVLAERGLDVSVLPDDARRRAPAQPRARRLRDQRRAAGGQEGRASTRATSRRWLAEALTATDGIAERRDRRARASSTSAWPPTRRARSSAQVARRRARLRRRRRARRASGSTWSSSPPTRPARCTSAAPAGPRSATRSAGSSRTQGAEVDPRVLLQRRRRPDRPVRPLAARRGPRRAGARGRLRRRLHRRDRRTGHRGSTRRRSALPDDEATEVFRPQGVELMFDEIKATLHLFRHRLRRLLPRELAARERAPWTTAVATAQGLRPPDFDDGAWWLELHRLRRRQGPGRHQVRRRRRLHRRRPRLLPGQAGPRLRPVHLHARRRPPRLHRPAQGRRRRVRRRPGRRRGADRADGQPGPGRRAGADEQAGRHRHHPRRPGRRARRRRRPVRADPLLGGLHASTSTSTCGPGRPTTTRCSTCSTRTPGWPRWPATPPTWASASATIHDPALLDTRAGGRADRTLGDYPQRRGHRRRAARTAPGRPLPGGAGRPATTSSTTRAGCCRWATRTPASCTPRAWPCARPPAGAGQRPRPCSASAPRSGCERASRPDRGTPRSARAGPAAASGRAGGADRPARGRLAARRRPRRRRCGPAGRRRRPRPRRAVRHAAVRHRRGRLPVPLPRFRRRVRRRRARALRGKAFLCTRDRPLGRRRGLSLDVCSGGELAVALRAGFPAERIALHGNNKSVAELDAGGRGRGRARSCVDSFARDRPAGRRRRRARRACQDVMVRVTVGRRGAHPRVHRDRPRGPEVRLLARRRRRATEAVRRGARRGRASAGRPALPHRLADLRPVGFEVAAHRVVGLLAQIVASRARTRSQLVDARPRRRLRHRLHCRATTRRPCPSWRPSCARSSPRECQAAGLAAPAARVEPGRAIAGPGTRHRSTRSAPSRTSPLDGGATRRYVSVDGGMSDNIRTALYDAEYDVALVSRGARRASRCCRAVVGKHCESGDIVVRDCWLPADLGPATCSRSPPPAPTATRWPATTTGAAARRGRGARRRAP